MGIKYKRVSNQTLLSLVESLNRFSIEVEKTISFKNKYAKRYSLTELKEKTDDELCRDVYGDQAYLCWLRFQENPKINGDISYKWNIWKNTCLQDKGKAIKEYRNNKMRQARKDPSGIKDWNANIYLLNEQIERENNDICREANMIITNAEELLTTIETKHFSVNEDVIIDFTSGKYYTRSKKEPESQVFIENIEYNGIKLIDEFLDAKLSSTLDTDNDDVNNYQPDPLLKKLDYQYFFHLASFSKEKKNDSYLGHKQLIFKLTDKKMQKEYDRMAFLNLINSYEKEYQKILIQNNAKNTKESNKAAFKVLELTHKYNKKNKRKFRLSSIRDTEYRLYKFRKDLKKSLREKNR